jgi:hypothetical protein
MRSPRWSVVAAAVAVTLLAGPAGCVAAAAATAAPRHGGERFDLTSRSSDSRRDHLRATGVLNARGYAIPSPLVSGRGSIKLQFLHGSVRLSIEVRSSAATPPNLGSCTFSEIYQGVYQVRGGERRYSGATGSGRFKTEISGRLVRSAGRCVSKLAWFRKHTLMWGSLAW